MDIQTLRQKRQKLMVQMVERKVRSRAQQLYDERGQGDGQALEDWVKAESEVLEKSILAPLYRRSRISESESDDVANTPDLASPESVHYESPA